jgi:hypothetical protein
MMKQMNAAFLAPARMLKGGHGLLGDQSAPIFLKSRLKTLRILFLL